MQRGTTIARSRLSQGAEVTPPQTGRGNEGNVYHRTSVEVLSVPGHAEEHQRGPAEVLSWSKDQVLRLGVMATRKRRVVLPYHPYAPRRGVL